MPACPSCNAQIEPWAKSCPQCGTTLKWNLPPAPHPSVVVPRDASSQTEEGDEERPGYLLILGAVIVILLCCACACLIIAIGSGLVAGLSAGPT